MRRLAYHDRSVCTVDVRPERETPPIDARFDSDRMVSCGWIHARVHEPSATLILSEAGREGDVYGTDRAFDLRTGALGAPSPEVRRALALPTSWLFASGALFATSALLALAPSRARRALTRSDQWSQATLRADGAIELPDGSTAPAPYAAGLLR